MGSQQFCLRWNNHQSNMLNLFDQLLQNEALVDVTLACDGLSIKAHKVVLSACSPYFQSLFLENPCQHPIVFLKDVQYNDLRALVDFMYKGEVNVNQEQLNAVLETAESLKVRGLAEVITTETSHAQSQQQATNGDGGDNGYQCAKILPITGNGYNAIEHQQPHLAHHQSMDFHPYLHHHSHHQHSRPVSQSPPPVSPKMPIGAAEMMESSSNKRSLSPTAKRRKAKPRKRLPESNIQSDHDDSDALDLSTASPEICMDTQDTPPYDLADCPRSLLATTSMTASLDQPSNSAQITNIKVEPEDNFGQNNDKDYNSNQRKGLSSPVSSSNLPATTSSSSTTSATLRMPIIPKLQPLSVSVNCPSASASALPSTSAIQASIIHQDIRRLCQYSRQSQQHKPTWTEEDMVQALEAVQSGRLTYALAARKFDIPKATLHYYVILMKAVEAVRSGRMTAEIAAIKYNVRTSILLDCLYGRQSGSSSSTGTPTPQGTSSSNSSAPSASASAITNSTTITPSSGGGLLSSSSGGGSGVDKASNYK
ncbi:hypothetical protein CHUAL_000828 [Chamberlinius hualienensis]